VPQQAVFNVGDTKKFELTNDSYYDVKVTLNGIKNSKANVSVIYINEMMTQTASTDEINAQQKEIESGQETAIDEGNEISKKIPIFWIVGIIIIAGIVVIRYLIKKRAN
jgi:beta-lactamase regulating signal transducer with metallopeptidase domain